MVKARPSNKNREARFLHFDKRHNGVTTGHETLHVDVVNALVGICKRGWASFSTSLKSVFSVSADCHHEMKSACADFNHGNTRNGCTRIR